MTCLHLSVMAIHISAEETKAQRGEVTCLRLHSKWVWKPGFETRLEQKDLCSPNGQNLPASPPPAASRMSQLEGTRFIAQEGASQGLWGVGQGSQAVAQKSCLLAGPETHQTRKEGGPGDGPCVHLQSLAHPQDSPEGQQAVTSMVHPPAWPHWLRLASPPLRFPETRLPPHPDSPLSGLRQRIHSLSKPLLSGSYYFM